MNKPQEFHIAVDAVARRLGHQLYHNYMGGSIDPRHGVEFEGAAIALAISYNAISEVEIYDALEVAANGYMKEYIEHQGK